MTESALKQRLTKYLREHLTGAVVLRHEDRITAGIPDLSVTWHGRTSWWEVKHANPEVRSRGIQELTLLRLAGAGQCWYIVYEQKKDIKRTLIIHPRHLSEYEHDRATEGFDNLFVAQFIAEVHGGQASITTQGPRNNEG